MTTEQAMAQDLDLCDLIEAIGSRSAKKKARAQRKAIFAHIVSQNAEDGLELTDDELLAELFGSDE